MLNSPTADASDTCNLFTPGELTTLKNRDPKVMSRILEANKAIADFKQWLAAYSSLGATEILRLSSALEIRAVMHAFNKKVESRSSFKSMLHVIDSVYEMAIKADTALPAWPKLAELREQRAKTVTSMKGSLRTVSTDGTIPDAVLKEKGFDVGVQVFVDSNVIWEITKLVGDQKVVELKSVKEAEVQKTSKASAKTKQGNVVEIHRADLLSNYKVFIAHKLEFLSDYPNPAEHKQLLRSIIEGQVKQAMLAEFTKASNAHKHCTVQTSPQLALTCNKAFAVGAFKLFPLTTVVVVDEKILDDPWMSLGEADLGNVYIRSGNTHFKIMQEGSKALQTGFVSHFFVAKATEVADTRAANCTYNYNEITVAVGQQKLKLKLPVIVNSVALKGGGKIIVSTADKIQMPPRKVQKTEAKKVARKST